MAPLDRGEAFVAWRHAENAHMTLAIDRFVPRDALRVWAAAGAAIRHRWVRRVVLVLAVAVAVAGYLHIMSNIYKGDAYGYWFDSRQVPLYYTKLDTAPHGYLYAPAFVQILWPLLALPWELFYGIWLGLLSVTLLWLVRPWLAIPVFALMFVPYGHGLPFILQQAQQSGNIYLFIGLAVVAGFRWPWTYSFLLLTKVTPGIGLLWFAVRREWRNLAIALGATAAIVAVSFVLAPSLWFDWFTVLKLNSGYAEPKFALHFLPLIPRLVIAVVLTIVGARFNARWVLPIATVLALPYIADTGLIILLCVIPLARGDAWTKGRGHMPVAETNGSEEPTAETATPAT